MATKVNLNKTLVNSLGKPFQVATDKKDEEGNPITTPYFLYDYITNILFNYSSAKEGSKRKEAAELWRKILEAKNKDEIELSDEETVLIKEIIRNIKSEDKGVEVGLEYQICWLLEGRELSVAPNTSTSAMDGVENA